MKERTCGDGPRRSQTTTSLPFLISNLRDLETTGKVQRVLDLGKDHIIAISNETIDAQHDGNPYTLVAGLYGPSGRQIQRFANLYYTAASRSAAESIAATLCFLRAQQLELLHQPVRLAWDADTAVVWVTDEKSRIKDVVGETRTTNVTYFDVTSQKEKNEFCRVVTHEWGHLAMQAARGFSSPEPDSAGHVGEALGMRWLLRLTPNPLVNAILPDTSYVEVMNGKFTSALAGTPPGTLGFTKRNAAGMSAYIGAILNIADTYGDAFLGRVFQAVDGDKTDAFLTAWAFILSEDGLIRVKDTAWVPLEAGIYTSSRRSNPAAWRGPGAIITSSDLEITVRRSGWYRFSTARPDSLTLRRKGR